MDAITRLQLIRPWVSEGAQEELDAAIRDIQILLSSCRPVQFQLNRGYEVYEHDVSNFDYAVRMFDRMIAAADYAEGRP